MLLQFHLTYHQTSLAHSPLLESAVRIEIYEMDWFQ